MKNKFYLKVLAFSFPLQVILIRVLANHPDFIEEYYSRGLYQIIAKSFRYLFGWIPFSVGDIVYASLLIYCLRKIIIHRKLIYQKPLIVFLNISAFISILYFLFNLFWGINYYRNPIHKTLKLKNKYTTKELVIVTEKLIQKTNTIHLKLVDNDTLKVNLKNSKEDLFNKTTNGFRNLKQKHLFLNYSPKSIKTSIWSLGLTYSGYSGYLNPFTNEAQVNSLIPKYYFPFVSCHEQAHQIGYAAENETNFIGYLACMNNTNLAFNYAGSTFALRYCLNEIQKRDKKTYNKLVKKINKGVLKNFDESKLFWKSYQNPLENIFKYIYDLFLKSNNQSKGIKSYSYVVALIVNYELEKE